MKRSGFSLIELMVVVAILSVSAAILVPRYLRHQIRGKQESCHQNLLSLFAAEKDFFEKNQAFAQDLNPLNWRPKVSKEKTGYEYRFLPAPSLKPDNPGFLFECVGNIDKDKTLDQAQINETGQINQISDDVKL